MATRSQQKKISENKLDNAIESSKKKLEIADEEVTNSEDSDSDDELAIVASTVAKQMKRFILGDTRVKSQSRFVVNKTADSINKTFNNREGTPIVRRTHDSAASHISDDESDEFVDGLQEKSQPKNDRLQLSSALHVDLDNDVYVGLDNYKAPNKTNVSTSTLEKEVMKKSILTPDFEKKNVIPPYAESVRQTKRQRKKERDMSKGKEWFDMKAPEMTEEHKNDLTLLQMRNIMDPKQFYKSNDIRALPKYFQVGHVVDDPVNFYHSRIPMKQRKRTLVDELLADADFRRYNRRKYTEIMNSKPSAYGRGGRGRGRGRRRTIYQRTS